jgi:hypothetical protein
MLFANIHIYVGRSDSLGTIVLPAKRSRPSLIINKRMVCDMQDSMHTQKIIER